MPHVKPETLVTPLLKLHTPLRELHLRNQERKCQSPEIFISADFYLILKMFYCFSSCSCLVKLTPDAK